MKQIIYRLVFLLALIPLLSFSNDIRGKYEKSKEVSKTFITNKSTVLNIKNKYGKVAITTWDKNSIEIEVKITVSGNDEEFIEEKLAQIFIDFEKTNNEVHATTNIKTSKSNSWFSGNWFSWSRKGNINFQIDYTVKMPIDNDLKVTNDYGSIHLDELNGSAHINCDYGKITIGSLNNVDNVIRIDYTHHSTIDFIEKAKIYADYSNFHVEKATSITLNADYTTSKFEQVENLNYNCDFGTLKVEKVEHIIGDGDYLSIYLGEINKSVDIKTSFGSLKIDKLNSNFEKANIRADYTGVKIGIDSNASCNIVAALSYGNFKYDGDLFIFNKKREESTSKSYEGYFNSYNTNATLKIDNEFGSIKLYQK